MKMIPNNLYETVKSNAERKVFKLLKDISLYMFIIFTAGVFFWLIYGLIISDLPIILANLITLVLSIFILIFKIKYK